MATIVNEGLAIGIRDIFRHVPVSNPVELGRSNHNWIRNNIFNRFVKCDMGGIDVEIPVFMRAYAEDYIINRMIRKPYTESVRELVAPMIDNACISKRSADSIIKSISDGNISYGLISVMTNKGLVYHGYNGGIFDSDFNPLLLATLVGHYNLSTSNNIQGITYTECRVYVHPKVVMDGTDIIHKAIMKKVIPYFLVEGDSCTPYTERISCPVISNIKIKILIEDTSRFFKTPASVRQSLSDEDINNFLASHADTVANQIKVGV